MRLLATGQNSDQHGLRLRVRDAAGTASCACYTIRMSVLWRRPRHKVLSPWLYRVMIVVCAAFASGVLAEPLYWNCLRQWRRPVQEWMIAHGLGAHVGSYGLLHLHFKDMILSFVGGLIFGWLGRSRWLGSSLLFATGYLLVPLIRDTAIAYLYGPPEYTVIRWNSLSIVSRLFLAVFPLAITGSWLGSDPRKRRGDARRGAGLCIRCGYDLRGNVSGRCPECGVEGPE